MKNLFMRFCFLFLMVAFCSNTFALNLTWNNSVPAGAWSTASNWIDQATSLAPAGIANTDNYFFINSTSIVTIDGTFSPTTINIDGGTPTFTATAARTFTAAQGLFLTSNATLTVTGTAAITLTLAGGASNIGAGSTLVFTGTSTGGSRPSCTGGTTTINGTLKLGLLSGNFSGTTGISFGASSIYEIAKNGGSIPGATWSATSTVLVTGATSSLPGLNGTSPYNLGNLIINSPALVAIGNPSWSSAIIIQGDLSLTTGTGGGLRFSTTPALVTIKGNLNINNGTLSPSNHTTGTLSLVVEGDITVATGGILSIAASSAPYIVTALKNVTINGLFTEIGTSTTSGLTFAGTSPQTLSQTGTISNSLKFIVNNAGNGIVLGSNVNLASDASPTSNLTLSSGGVKCDGFNLKVPAAATLTLLAANKIITNSNGSLTLKTVPVTGKNFPIGIDASSFDQIAVTPTVAGDVTVGVKDATAGFGDAEFDATKTCNREWNVVSAVPSAILEFSPDPASGCPGVVDVIGHYVAGAWTETANAGVGPFNSYPYSAAFSSFSPFGVGGAGGFSGALPVELTTFTARKNAQSSFAILNWSTASEHNNDHFEIQTSTNGTDFSNIDEVKGKGNSTAANDYTYAHKSPVAGRNYYRLKQVDKDGKFAYSGVQVVMFGKINGINIVPTQATDQISISFDQALTENATWEITNIEGRIVKSGTINAETTTQNIETYDLQAGQYFVRLLDNNQPLIAKFVKM
jgi:Secretion system C-terminal sorting domain